MTNLEKVFTVMQRRRIGASTQYALVPHGWAALQKAGGAGAAATRSSSGWLTGIQMRAGILMAVLACTLTMLTGCRGASKNAQSSDEISPGQLFMFSPLTSPNPATGVAALRVDLGRSLYYDRHLSENASISCNSCHDLANYGVDPGNAVSTGHNKLPGGRNSPTVYNAGLQFVQFWDGRRRHAGRTGIWTDDEPGGDGNVRTRYSTGLSPFASRIHAAIQGSVSSAQGSSCHG